ncbi:hypothetical protein AAKU67_003586 [Oxalobacteraceae bacterium GrIS 2.11]
MNTNFAKMGVIAALSLMLTACVVAPPQPIGYRMTSSVLPTYVNGQYVGMQPSNYVAPSQVASNEQSVQTQQTQQQVAQTQQVQAQQAPVYIQSTTPSIVYVQAPTPVYAYPSYPYYAPSYYSYPYPYYSPFYSPWCCGLSVGIGFGFHGHRR